LKFIRNTYAFAIIILVVSVLVSCSRSNIYAPVYNKHNPVKTATPGLHIVRAGDTLYSIAWQNGQDYKLLAKWNNISWPYTIYAGQQLALTGHGLIKKKETRSPVQIKKNHTKQKIIKNTSTNYQKKLKLKWQWPISVKRLKNGTVKSGVILYGSPKELVRSSESGKVVYAGSGLKGYGNLLIIKHDDEYLTAYGYNRTLLVNEGDIVKKGQAIAEIGSDNEGRKALFFEMRRHGKAVSVVKYLPRLRG